MQRVDTVAESAVLQWGGDSQLGALPASAAFSGFPPPPLAFFSLHQNCLGLYETPLRQQEKGKV